MRSALFRTLAGLIVVLGIWAVCFSVIDSDRSWESLFEIGSAFIGLLFIVPTMGAYALKGEKAGNRVLVGASRIMNLPAHWFDRLLRKHVEVPPEYDELEAREDPDKIGTMGGG